VGYVLVDSFLIYRKPFPQDHLDHDLALRIADRLREKGNYAEAIMPMGRRPLKTYATSKDVAGVRSIGPDHVFTERFWDFDLGQEIPATITASVQEGMEKFDTERNRTAIMEATKFLVFASLSPDIYEVIDLRPLSKPAAQADDQAVP
jgi:alpha-D-ribose 1-methylphosphonate 5-triphosphate synthase subunit PhnI